MINVTINMSMQDYEFIKAELSKASNDTLVTNCLEECANTSDNELFKDLTERTKSANAHINYVLNRLGM